MLQRDSELGAAWQEAKVESGVEGRMRERLGILGWLLVVLFVGAVVLVMYNALNQLLGD